MTILAIRISFYLKSIFCNSEGDRYYYYQKYYVKDLAFYPLIGGPSTLTNNAYEVSFIMDYSNGSGGSIDENSLTESLGLRRTGSTGIDFNGDLDTIDTVLSKNLNGTEDASLDVFSDYNDWANINLFFSRYFSGNNSVVAVKRSQMINDNPIYNDKQEVHKETLTKDM